ncbi:MAG: energy transducer TonB [Marinifilaceae bacterium]
MVSFIIDETGKVCNPKVERSVDPILDKEALRVISMMPNWKPGKQRGKPVKVSQIMPIRFALERKRTS